MSYTLYDVSAPHTLHSLCLCLLRTVYAVLSALIDLDTPSLYVRDIHVLTFRCASSVCLFVEITQYSP